MKSEATEATRSAHLGWLLLLPIAALAWPGPGALVAHDPYPHLAATGFVLLFALPAAIALPFVPSRALRGVLVWATLWALVALFVGFGRPDDSFEARRTLAHFTCLTVALLGGAHLGLRGRDLFLRGLVLLSLAFTAGAFGIRLAGGGHLAGVLGDTGSVSQAALPGAIVGVWYFAMRRGPWRVIGLAATVGTIAHASVAPVIGAGGAFVVALVASSLRSPFSHNRSRVRRRVGMCAALAFFALIGLRGLHSQPVPEVAEPTTGVDTDLGGVDVRLRIWKRIPALLGSAPVLGIGPGQFQAAFPPFRDPREIEISRHGICSEVTTEVEHAHDDYLEGLAEFGLVGGAFWLLFLALVARGAFGALSDQDEVAGAAGAAVLALLLNALYHAPLLFNAAAAFPGFVLFGMLLGRNPVAPVASRALRLEVALAALLAVPAFAWPAIVHGRELTAYLRTQEHPDEARRHLDRALAAVPDSAPVFQLSDFLALLEVRPNSVQAHEQLGTLFALFGQPERARAHLERALELSPTHPRILRNLVRLEYGVHGFERGAAYLKRLQELGCLGADWPAELGESFVRTGQLEAGARLMFGLAPEELLPEELDASAQALEDTDPDRARALRTLANLLWARGHVARGDFSTAVRSYRQAWNATRSDGQGARSVRLEMAAAELLAGRRPNPAELESGAWPEESLAPAWPELPEWARTALVEAGHGPDG